MSPLAARVAAMYVAMDPEAEAPQETQEQTALPRKGPSKMILQKTLENMSDALEKGDHAKFKRGLSDLADNFERMDAKETEAWTPKSIAV